MAGSSERVAPEMLRRTVRGDWREGEGRLTALEVCGMGSVCELAREVRRVASGRVVWCWMAWKAMAAGEGPGGLIRW